MAAVGTKARAPGGARLKASAPPLQEGIYWDRGQRPPGFFALLLLHAVAPDASSVSNLLGKLWDRYQELKQGLVDDLPGVRVPAGDLAVLLGFGAKAFTLTSGKLAAPEALKQWRFARGKPGEPIATVSKLQQNVAQVGDNLADSGIHYATDASETDLITDAGVHFAVQFTASTPLAVERAVVETWKVLYDERKLSNRPAALEIAAVFTGSQRDDERSWIDFHDGLSNLSHAERKKVIPIRKGDVPGPEAWTANGTYLAFIRLGIDLGTWRGEGRRYQQRFVGRDKINGCPDYWPPKAPFEGTPVVGCPLPHMLITNKKNKFRDPTTAELLPDPNGVEQRAHMNRAHDRNPGQDPHSSPGDLAASFSFRIFRQGYPFFEPNPQVSHPRNQIDFEQQAHLRVGLNFVSFQNNPRRLIAMLTTASWLGGTNFGGYGRLDPGPRRRRLTLVRAYATGMFFVPPPGKPFPGAQVLGIETQ
jgi:deferrochelatase/peroxidase EfeB